MDPLELIRLNLLTPPVLAFGLGVIAVRAKSDLKFPEEVYAALSIYLLLAIGLKGGAELSVTPLAAVWKPGAATLFLGVVTPLIAYWALRRLGKFDVTNSAAIAAHYGSASVVTFTAALTFLEAMSVAVEKFLPTLVVLLEIPAIIIALALARASSESKTSWREAIGEIVSGKSVLLLVGGLVIGALAGKAGLERVAPLFVSPFYGVLTLFLLEMGMIAARRLRDVRKVGSFLLGFAIIVPVLHGMLGVALGKLCGLSLGGTMVLATLSASASYIAAPAAVRIALPQANPSYYLTAALGITFPFNLTVGIPLYFAMAKFAYGM